MDKNNIQGIVDDYLAGTGYYLVSLTIGADNRIEVVIDHNEGVSLDFCADLNRHLNEKLDREVEDYELEVSSAGLTSPFKVKQQYVKNIGNPVVLLTNDGRKIHGTLAAAGDDDFQITCEVKKVVEGSRKKQVVEETLSIGYDNVKQICYDLVV